MSLAIVGLFVIVDGDVGIVGDVISRGSLRGGGGGGGDGGIGFAAPRAAADIATFAGLIAAAAAAVLVADLLLLSPSPSSAFEVETVVMEAAVP